MQGSWDPKRSRGRWLKKLPLRDTAVVGGASQFATGDEASALLIKESLRRDPHQSQFLETVEDLARDLAPVFDREPERAWAFKKLIEPERVVQFQVPWQDDSGNARVARGYRVQFNSALGPYLGGVRLHRALNHSTTKPATDFAQRTFHTHWG